jgi:hypothetical protein
VEINLERYKVKQLADSSDDEDHQPSALIESFQNPLAQLASARGNPSLGLDECGTGGNSVSIL